ncbi:hypothetical protein KN815_20655, partial [Streptomyces sp. 4503]|nr:hypothetical protein [Streptomyces niphimycinicus]
MIERLCALLEDAGVELSEEELRDALWFAATTAPARSEEGAPTPSPGATGPASGAADGDDDGKGDKRQLTGPPTEGEPEPGPLTPAGLYAPGAA